MTHSLPSSGERTTYGTCPGHVAEVSRSFPSSGEWTTPLSHGGVPRGKAPRSSRDLAEN